MSKRTRTYDPLKCQRRVIATIETKGGKKISLLKHHAFDWSVAIENNGKITINSMSRQNARKEYERLKNLFN